MSVNNLEQAHLRYSVVCINVHCSTFKEAWVLWWCMVVTAPDCEPSFPGSSPSGCQYSVRLDHGTDLARAFIPQSLYIGTRSAEHQGGYCGLQWIDGCNLELCSIYHTASGVIWHMLQNKFNSTSHVIAPLCRIFKIWNFNCCVYYLKCSLFTLKWLSCQQEQRDPIQDVYISNQL